MTYEYVKAVCGLEEHEQCMSVCGIDPIHQEDIQSDRVIKLIVHKSLVCYDIASLYEWLLIRNREPTTQPIFSEKQLTYISERYRLRTSREDIYDLAITGVADIYIRWMKNSTTWKSSPNSRNLSHVSLDEATETITKLIHTNAGWSRDSMQQSFSIDLGPHDRVTLANLDRYIGEEWLLSRIFHVLYKHMTTHASPIGYHSVSTTERYTNAHIRTCLEVIQRALLSYIENQSRAQIFSVFFDRYVAIRSPSWFDEDGELFASSDIIGTWIAENGFVLSEYLSVESFEAFGHFQFIDALSNIEFVRIVDQILLSILEEPDKDDFVWTQSIEVIRRELSASQISR